ncbi:type VII secretion-associated serine protease mycosin [Actinoplanes sp. NPDC051851]|uniref:type VII secretion-associated serine protease mycosin n=1 Tax=Actinoplanes sp. NPDC051851 TaxID=3154753 RepID=UPI00343EC20C
MRRRLVISACSFGRRPGLRRCLGAVTLAGVIALGPSATAAWADPVGPGTQTSTLNGPLGTPVTAQPVAELGLATADTVRADQWQVGALDLADAWTYADGSGVIVAVIDSGVDATHVDLAGQVLPGLDLVDPAGTGDTDPVGHGTTVSGIIAGRNDDNAGVVGIAPKAKILPVRVLDDQNRYDDAMIVARALRWAVDNGARVVNLSLGGGGSSPALAAALDYAFAKDVVVVACTGNVNASSTDRKVWYPAREPGVIAVAGTERDDSTLWSGSITGRETVVSAPATDLVGARPGGYWKVQGTSFASPMVAGTAALIRSRWPDMPAGEVVNRIIKTATDLGAPGRDAQFGYGLINPVQALTASVPAVQNNPLDTTPPDVVARFGSAPSPGEAQAEPQETTSPTATATATGPNAGGWAEPATIEPAGPHPARWIAVLLFLISAMAAGLTIRRFAGTAG